MQGTDSDNGNTKRPGSLGDQARSLGREAKEAAMDIGDKARSTFEAQANNLGDRAKDAAAGAGRKIGNAWEGQRASGADYLENVAGLVHEAADVFDQEVPQASRYIHQAAEQIDTVADAVRTKSMREVASDVEDFARRQPAIFFGGALLLGFAAVRVFKASPPASNRPGASPGPMTS